MKTPDEDWSDLSRTWMDTGTEPAPFDARLIRAVRRRDTLARLNFVAEVGGAVVCVGVVVWAALMRGLPWPPAIAAAAFAVFALAMTLWSRRGGTASLTETPQAVLRSAIAQARLGIRWACAGIAISAAASVFLLVLAIQPPPAGGAAGAWLFVGGVVFLIVAVGFYLRHLRRCRRRIAIHEAALAALGEPSIPA